MRTPEYKSLEMSKWAEPPISEAAAYCTMKWKIILGIAGAARMFLAQAKTFSTFIAVMVDRAVVIAHSKWWCRCRCGRWWRRERWWR